MYQLTREKPSAVSRERSKMDQAIRERASVHRAMKRIAKARPYKPWRVDAWPSNKQLSKKSTTPVAQRVAVAASRLPRTNFPGWRPGSVVAQSFLSASAS
jgi:hypothetical protein